ncbi:catalase family peroxidase [Paracraurococcus lichenis]|uniref:Catalase-related peroxidase n=1 Tax=Paracraurococcus lichenis TaxID=3064888 RepID=A0ABT9E149_9PROT|nr:catalase family peroxidase [Paracraurococcus sp. LOR1-02]MDO9709892.1 catalase family peroxidase [Paracraurococcus sp. LOR1-02]
MRLTGSLLLAALLAGPGLVSPAWAQPATEKLPQSLYDTMVAGNGRIYPGYRVNHTKGALYEGTFTPAPGAASLTTAPHLQSTPSTLVLRYSDAGGVPDVPDTAPSSAIRGLAFTFRLPDGTETDLMMINVPVFAARTPDEFLGLLRAVQATKPDLPAPTPIAQFLGSHPQALRFVQMPKPVPQSFATERFFALHAYRLTNAAGETRFVRFRVVPEAGTAYRAPESLGGAAPDLLFDEIRTRVAAGPVRYRLEGQVAAAGDVTNDPTVAWPEDRQVVELGTISVTRAVPDSLSAERKVGFLPNRVLPGLALSDDPFLQTRADVYAIAFPARQ